MTEKIGLLIVVVSVYLLSGTPGRGLQTVVQLVGVNKTQGQGELQFTGIGGWSSVCSESIGVIEAQMICQDLGFSFFFSIGAVNIPAPAASPLSISEITCIERFGMESSLGVALTTLCTIDCDRRFAFSACVTTVYLECQNASTEEYGLVAFTDQRKFWIIVPDIPVLTMCYSEEFYCDPVSLVSRNEILLRLFETGGTCHTVNMKLFLGLDCLPGSTISASTTREGDVCLVSVSGACREEGLVTYTKDMHRVGVCASSFGFLEAYVVCSQHGLPRPSIVSHKPYTNYNLSTEVITVDCNGTESNLNDCVIGINSVTENCSEIAYLECEPGDFQDTVLVGVSDYSPGLFTIISPVDGVYEDGCGLYLDSCQSTMPIYYPGVYYMNRSLPIIQEIITQLQANQSCNDLGPFDLNIAYTCLPLPTTSIQMNILSVSVSSTITVSQTNTPTSKHGVALAGLAVILPILALVVTISGVMLFVDRRHKQREKVLKELQYIHNVNDKNVYARSSLLVMRPHRSVEPRRTSTMEKDAPNDMEIPFECLTLDKEIGSGAYGSIYHGVIACEHQAEPVEVAVKLLKEMATASERRSLQLEINMMKDLGAHRHLVSMLACCSDVTRLALVLEYVPGGNLHSYLRKHRQNITKSKKAEEDSVINDGKETRDSTCYEALRGGPSMIQMGDKTPPSNGSLTLIDQLQLARQITLGMEYLASKRIVHRDLAARNILVGEDKILKLADFGLSRDIRENEHYHMQSKEDKLPVRWMAVESIIDREFTIMSDVWAFGVVLWEIMTYAAFPFYHLTNREVIASVKDGERLAQPDDCPNDVYVIMTNCWKTNPLQRPSIRVVRQMLDELLDTGGYIHLTNTAQTPVHAHGPPDVEELPSVAHGHILSHVYDDVFRPTSSSSLEIIAEEPIVEKND